MFRALWNRLRPPYRLPYVFADVQAQLLPCPFCGGDAAFQLRARTPGKLVIMCKVCPAEMDVTYKTAEAAGDIWNARNRAGPPA
ncbi:Lar family restriction alleviation protein [Bradyrhizobium japonicum]|uniref:Lar family restriction alleviation protein n=1 Tax=Bradyrhizobium japonicum TaxID=375 RepID=UPI001BAD294B|nr:Lar family restriction alleviation protein [Bradyrhizobium japonicum]